MYSYFKISWLASLSSKLRLIWHPTSLVQRYCQQNPTANLINNTLLTRTSKATACDYIQQVGRGIRSTITITTTKKIKIKIKIQNPVPNNNSPVSSRIKIVRATATLYASPSVLQAHSTPLFTHNLQALSPRHATPRHATSPS